MMLRYRVKYTVESGDQREAIYPYLSEIVADMDYLAEHSPDVQVSKPGVYADSPIWGSEERWISLAAHRAFEYHEHRRGNR